MSVSIRLDRPALLALVDKDPEFRLDLTGAVVSEVIRKVFEKDMGRLMKEAEPELFKQALAVLEDDNAMAHRVNMALTERLTPRAGYTTAKLSPAGEQLFREATDQAAVELSVKVGSILNAYVTEQAKAKVDALLENLDIDSRIAKRFDRMLDEELEKRVREHHEALLAKLKAVLG